MKIFKFFFLQTIHTKGETFNLVYDISIYQTKYKGVKNEAYIKLRIYM